MINLDSFFQRMIKVLNYISLNLIHLGKETREFLAKQLGNKYGEGSNIGSQHEGRSLARLSFQRQGLTINLMILRVRSRFNHILPCIKSLNKIERNQSFKMNALLHGRFVMHNIILRVKIVREHFLSRTFTKPNTDSIQEE